MFACCDYREYRVYSDEVGQERDETLQVWAWGDSYATQYRNTPSGGEAMHAGLVIWRQQDTACEHARRIGHLQWPLCCNSKN